VRGRAQAGKFSDGILLVFKKRGERVHPATSRLVIGHWSLVIGHSQFAIAPAAAKLTLTGC
jgi:hypothetical protein